MSKYLQKSIVFILDFSRAMKDNTAEGCAGSGRAGGKYEPV
ncbi:MAG: hypothetical protein VB085_00675 [Peptococcaceae bacterium]|nr:hypothetical protein [Peptococcaceae bacterium]